MSPEIAAVVYGIGILALFLLDRDRDLRTSKALWIPVLWILIASSRPLSAWLQGAPPNPAETYLDGSPLDRFIFTCLLAAGLLALIKRGGLVAELLRNNQAILLFFTYCGVSVLWSDYPDVAFRRWIKFVGNLVMVLVVLTDSDPLSALKRLLARAGFILLPFSVLLIKYYGGLGRTYSAGDRISDPWRLSYTGVTDTKNGLGAICMLFGLGALWQFVELLQDKDKPNRLRHLVAQGTVLMAALRLFGLANSMTSVACFLLAGGLVIALTLPPVARRTVAVHVFVVALLACALLAIFVAPNLLSSIGRDPTLTGRTDIWHTVLGLAGNPMLGTGFESFWLGSRLQTIWNTYWWHPNEAHNGYIEAFVNLGWVGVGLMAFVIIVGYRSVLTSFLQRPEEGKVKLAYFVVGIVYNVTESAFRMIDPVWFFFLLAIVFDPEAAAIREAEPAYLAAQDDGFPQPEEELSSTSFTSETRRI
jgi:exopolysaccharide production protein ExoQ